MSHAPKGRAVVLCLLATSAALAACTEKPQTATARKADASPWVGNTGTDTAPGWKAGDAVSWETQMRTRAQGQNEYSRAAAP